MSASDPSPKESPSSQTASYLEPYRRAIETFGPSFEATLWRSPQMQIVRFDIFTSMVDFTDRVIVDAGSGQGGLAAYLTSHGIRYRRYIGLDAMPEMVDQSEAQGLADAAFQLCDFAGEMDSFSRFARAAGGPGVDVVVFSGSLNTLAQAEAIGVLERAWDAVDHCVVFNFLSDRAGADLLSQETAPARRFDTVAMLDWALSRTTAVRFRQDYFRGHDATIAMFKAH